MNKYSITHSLFLLVSLFWLANSCAYAIDWQRLPGQKITLFYPGQSSWEWLLTEHEGASEIKSGKFCRECHADIQQEMGQKLISGAFLEPKPIAGKASSVEIEIKSTYDAENLYLHLAWTATPQAGANEYPDYEAMASLMLDDGRVPEIARGGCWGPVMPTSTACPMPIEPRISPNIWSSRAAR
nr:ethylbenzene dehydrogenase-related protein [Methylomarinum sp. Ch1-1]MDP4522493.1 ethylbenzene dehydrogenase-related protein [Methylomarinum sp. Ch1-1]